jgi:tRNA dimethylallyltransferase
MDFSQKKLIVVVGPTAVGKTGVAIALAKLLHTEIISADSRQIFRELAIGTAKPTAAELSEAKHHFIDSHSIHDQYDAAQYGEAALALIYELFKKYDYLVVCGGSGLYVKALLEGFDDIPEIPEGIREDLQKQFDQSGLVWLQQKMKELDPEHFNRIDNQNPVRLMRALEVRIATGKSISTFQGNARRVLPFQVVKIGLELERDILYKRIDDRMDSMIAQGLFEEAEKVYPHKQLNALQTVGYQEIFDYLDKQYDKAEAIRLLKRNTRHYAKRQLTWFKRDVEIKWMSPERLNDIVALVKD